MWPTYQMAAVGVDAWTEVLGLGAGRPQTPGVTQQCLSRGWWLSLPVTRLPAHLWTTLCVRSDQAHVCSFQTSSRPDLPSLGPSLSQVPVANSLRLAPGPGLCFCASLSVQSVHSSHQHTLNPTATRQESSRKIILPVLFTDFSALLDGYYSLLSVLPYSILKRPTSLLSTSVAKVVTVVWFSNHLGNSVFLMKGGVREGGAAQGDSWLERPGNRRGSVAREGCVPELSGQAGTKRLRASPASPG